MVHHLGTVNGDCFGRGYNYAVPRACLVATTMDAHKTWLCCGLNSIPFHLPKQNEANDGRDV